MSDQWNFFQLLVEDKPASMMANLSIAARAPIAGHANFFYVRLYMLNPRDDGLSSSEEFDQLVAVEDRITAAVQGGSTAIFVGRNTCDGTRDHYFYVADPVQVQTLLNGLAPSLLPYEIESGGYEDAAWSVYFDFIYPSPEDMQRILNRGVRDQLAEHGDDHMIVRQIDHFAYFGSESARDLYRDALVRNGFQIDNANQTPDGKFALVFTRADRPNDLDEVTIELSQMAEERGGEYDGWGCNIATN